MKKIRALKLGTTCIDKATGLTGTLTHWVCDMSATIRYIFQPKGLDEKGQPLPYISLELERLKINESMFEEIEIPFEVLGTQVTDKASGFKGMGVSFVRHINGCFHVVIQPAGLLRKKGTPVDKRDFSLLQCEGPKIPKLTEKQVEKSKRDGPSPAGHADVDYIPSGPNLPA